MSNAHRKIWENHFGKIPVDENSRTFEIHHIDGDHNNNDPQNLLCVSIKEHYDIHYKNGDYGACVMIAKRMQLSSDHISNIQKGVKRPGIGGVKKGSVPWNKGIKGYTLNISEDGKKRKLLASKRNNKITEHEANHIRHLFFKKINIDDDRIGKKQRNGKIFTYDRAFCDHMSKSYNVSLQRIVQLIKHV